MFCLHLLTRAFARARPCLAAACFALTATPMAAADDPSKKWDLAGLKERGKEVYAAKCVPCHQANGQGIPGAFPSLDGSPIVKGPVKEHLNRVLNGKNGTSMASFGKQLSDTDIAAVITYERNSWSNKTGDVLQPADVKAARK
jgi:cytochrome c oxidase subunit 2